jgi:hypothetical protein
MTRVKARIFPLHRGSPGCDEVHSLLSLKYSRMICYSRCLQNNIVRTFNFVVHGC